MCVILEETMMDAILIMMMEQVKRNEAMDKLLEELVYRILAIEEKVGI